MRCEKLPKSEIVKLNRDENDIKDSKYKNRKKIYLKFVYL